MAHAVKDANGRSYNRTKYLGKRLDLVQLWGDDLDKLRCRCDEVAPASQPASQPAS